MESFGPTVADWAAEPSSGKKTRLASIVALLGLSGYDVSRIRYQLLHRSASAVLEADRFTCPTAVVLVHSFANAPDSFADYSSYLALFGLKAKKNLVAGPVRLPSVNLYFAWVQDKVPSGQSPRKAAE
jgi:hypothetical protein